MKSRKTSLNTADLAKTVKNLSDKGVSNSRIAALTGTSRNRVGGILAWHRHRDSWKNLKKSSKNFPVRIAGIAILFA